MAGEAARPFGSSPARHLPSLRALSTLRRPAAELKGSSMADMTDPKTVPGYDAAANSMSTASKSMQNFASELQRVSKDQMDATSQLMEKLRGAKTMEEVVSLQSGFMQQSFANYAEYTRKIGEMMMNVPMAFAKQSQSAFQQGVGAMTKATESAGEQIQKVGDQFNQHHG